MTSRGAPLRVGIAGARRGHSFLAGIERIRELRGSRQLTLEEARLIARAGIVFTTHTPVAAGSDYFPPALVYDLLGPYLTQTGISFDRFMELGRERPQDHAEPLCTTYVCLRLADTTVGVSRLHGTVSQRLWKAAWPGRREAHSFSVSAPTQSGESGTGVCKSSESRLATGAKEN